jgi:hypothetical protein
MNTLSSLHVILFCCVHVTPPPPSCVVLTSRPCIPGFIENIQLVIQVTTAPTQIYTLYIFLQHKLSLLSLLYLQRLSPVNGFQRRSFVSFRVHAPYLPAIVSQLINSRLVVLVSEGLKKLLSYSWIGSSFIAT